MKKNNIKTLVFTLLAIFFSAFSANASSPDDKPFDAGEMIMHHIADSHEWHVFGNHKDGNAHLTIPLPVILWTEGNLDVFMSSEFHHGENTVTKGDRTYKIEHEHVVEASGKKVMDFSITKNVASMMLAATVMTLIFLSVASGYRKRGVGAPKGIQAVFEPLIIFIRDDIAVPNIGEAKYRKYMPYLLTVFFFIWLNNIFGLLPTGANASGNIAFTITLAAITLLITSFSGNKDYWMHILWTPGVPLWLRPIMIIVEIIGIFSKPFALTIRLFANITAGHIIILSLLSFIFIFKSIAVGIPVSAFVVVMTFMELFVAALQAYIFTLLSALFIGTAVAEHEHHDEAHAHH